MEKKKNNLIPRTRRRVVSVKNPSPALLPAATESEKIVLGTVLLEPTCLQHVAKNLTPETFANPYHKKIARAYLDLFKKGLSVEQELLMEELEQAGAKVSPKIIADLSDVVPVPTALTGHLKNIKEKAILRNLALAGEGLSQQALSGQESPAELIAKAEKSFSKIRESIEEEKGGNWAGRQIIAMSATEFLGLNFPPRENILAPWLPTQGLAMIHAPRGIGKTHLSLSIAYTVASSGNLFGWSVARPCGVLFIDGEMPGSALQERLARIAISSETEPQAHLRIITPDLQSNGMIDLSRAEDQAELEPHLEGIALIIVDNLSTLCRSGRENEGESWLPVQEWALWQRAAGRSVLFIHHSGKGGAQRGTSRREDVLDTVINLRRPGDYSPDQGATFEVHFEKARGIFGEDTKPFEARLTTTPDGRHEWLTKPLEQSTAEKVADFLLDGMPQKEIPELLGLSKGAVSKAKMKAERDGLLSAKG